MSKALDPMKNPFPTLSFPANFDRSENPIEPAAVASPAPSPSPSPSPTPVVGPAPNIAVDTDSSDSNGSGKPEVRKRPKLNPFVQSNYQILLTGARGNTSDSAVNETQMRRYLNAGFALSDYYCEQFFRYADESQRRRQFGRALTNDAGTVITSILGLANAGQNVVTGVAAGFGFGDNIWRNYEEAFVVSPDLSTVQALVTAAQDNFRQKTLGKRADGETESEIPQDYGKAQSVIMRYAHLCSTLGMRALLNQSSNDQRLQLEKETKGEVEKDSRATGNPDASQGIDGQANAGGKPAPNAGNAVPNGKAPVTPPAIPTPDPQTAPQAAQQAIPG